MGRRGNISLAACVTSAICAVALVCGAVSAPTSASMAAKTAKAQIAATAVPVGAHSAADGIEGAVRAGAPREAPEAESAIATAYGASGAEYEAKSVVVSLPAGVSPDEALATIVAETGIDGLALAEPVDAVDPVDADAAPGGEAVVELSLPPGVDAQEAAELIGASSAVDAAQPNYIYHLQSETSAVAGAAASSQAAAAAGTLALTADGTLAQSLVAQATAVDDSYISLQWALRSIYAYGDRTGVGNAWDVARTEGDVAVAVIDEGFYKKHPDLAANVVATYNAVDGTKNVSEMADQSGHGTHVAGIIAAVADNGIGIAGVSYNARLVLIKAAEEGGGFTSRTLARAVNYAVANRAKYNIRVINMSISGGQTSMKGWEDDLLIRAIDRATAAGIVVVSSAGNTYTDRLDRVWVPPYIDYPGDYKNVVGVISLERESSDPHDVDRDFDSNYNIAGVSLAGMPTGKNISAPGSDILSTLPTSRYGYRSGTSMAAPYVAGTLALIFAKYPDLTASEAKSLLYSTATDVLAGGAGWDRETGFGEVNAYRAVTKEGYLSGKPSVKVGATTVLCPSKAGSWVWRTSNAGIATVSDGVVKGVSAGTVRITARRTVAGRIVALQQIVTVYDPVISGASSVAAGSTKRLSVEGSPAGSWKWSSSDKSVATVNKNGVVKGIKPGTVTITVRLTDDRTVFAKKKVKVKRISLARAKVTAKTQLYTGKALTPAPTVKLGGKKLKRGTDYTVTYKNNRKVGTATITVKGKGLYRGTASGTFKIVRKPS